MDPEEFNTLFSMILKKVIVVSTETILPYREKALEIVKDIDINDAIFIACALAYPKSVIWSDDKGLKKQKHIKVVNTNEIKSII